MTYRVAGGPAALQNRTPQQPLDDAELRRRVCHALETVCVDTCERITGQMVRAYGTALTWWMTGRRGFDAGPGPHAEQHARISQHYRKALADGVAQEYDRRISEHLRSGAWPARLFDATRPDRLDLQAAKEQTCRQAQTLFLRGQYRVNLLFFSLFVDLARSRERAGVEACLRGATPTRAQPPRDPEP